MSTIQFPNQDQQSTTTSGGTIPPFYTDWDQRYCTCPHCPCCGKPIRQYGYTHYPWQWNDPWITYGPYCGTGGSTHTQTESTSLPPCTLNPMTSSYSCGTLLDLVQSFDAQGAEQ